MKWMHVVVLIALFEIALGLAPADASSRPTLTRAIMVDPVEFRCLLTNLDRVPSEPRGVFVDFRACDQDGVKVIRHLYAPTPTTDPTGNESILFVKPLQLACMKRFRNNVDRILETLPDNRHRLKIDPCGR